MYPALILTLFLIMYMGLRPVSHVFGDTVNYAYIYRHSFGQALFNINLEEEWMWDFILLTCKKM